jgi:glycosyltransferase involved in cell wall biosynthesis
MLAIIIPYYKLTFFEATLQSLAAQTCQDFKVYIGDDASPEDPTELLHHFQGQFNFVYHRFETNLGGVSLTKQWERCIALSDNEEWLMILGDDDVLGENVVEAFYSLINEKSLEIDLIRCKLEVIKNDSLIENTFDYQLHENSIRFLQRILSLAETITASEFIFRREIYKKKGGFDDYPLAWFSDYATWLKFSESTGIYNLINAKVFWRLSTLNISGTNNDIENSRKKVQSLFMFINFVKSYDIITNFEIKKFAMGHFRNLTIHFTYWDFFELFKATSNKNIIIKIQIFTSILLSRFKNQLKSI